MFDDFSEVVQVHTGKEWKMVAVKTGAGLAAIVFGRCFENVSKDTETACTANDPRCIGEHRDHSNGRDWNEYVSVQDRNGYFGKTYHSG